MKPYLYLLFLFMIFSLDSLMADTNYQAYKCSTFRAKESKSRTVLDLKWDGYHWTDLRFCFYWPLGGTPPCDPAKPIIEYRSEYAGFLFEPKLGRKLVNYKFYDRNNKDSELRVLLENVPESGFRAFFRSQNLSGYHYEEFTCTPIK